MTGLVRKATLLAVCGLLTASVAMAHVPDPAHCVCPVGCIYVVGHNGVVGDPFGAFCVTVKDFNNNLIINSSVVIDLSQCDINLCANQLDPDVTVDCISMTARKVTDNNGQACFRIIGKAKTGLVPCSSPVDNCCRIYADGVFLCSVRAPAFDLINAADGSGVGSGDLSAWITLFLCQQPNNNPRRGDYNCDGSVGSADLARWITVFVGQKSALNCPPPKNNQTGPKCLGQ